ncbi:hypothetical protein Fcan01_20737 [Folsomia candida]|uniref:Uncharacterized protein n=1 Tax=Folsomia candida TaxID=158441 RepID=A0A226DGH3_FOLCA|nr:hypothetical protein Fcan01_20737 [Folsomia candida]
MLTWYELSRIVVSIPTMGLLWGEMQLKNILCNFVFLMFTTVGVLVIMTNFCIVRVVTAMPAIMSATLIYASLAMGTLMQIMVTVSTRRNEELSEILRHNREGAGMVGGTVGKMIRREVKSLQRGWLGLSVTGAYFGHFDKNTKILLVNIIFSKTLDALIIYN